MGKHMAREMPPQERAEAVHNMLVLAPTREAKEDNLRTLEAALQAARRAALLEAAQVAITYGGRARDEDLSGSYTSELIVQALDRLAQEGASSIDLSPTIKDDGGYGEHF